MPAKTAKPAKSAKQPKSRIPLVIATSSSALFDLSESDEVYRTLGIEKYEEYQLDNEAVPLKQGYAFSLIEKILKINRLLMEEHRLDAPIIEVILLSRNSANTGLRVLKSIKHYELDISRGSFGSGSEPAIYGKAFNCQLFLSKHPGDVADFINNGLGAATIYATHNTTYNQNELHIAFDGDAVIFDESSEKIYAQDGIKKFQQHEQEKALDPLNPGPFKPFLEALSHIQKNYLNHNNHKVPHIRTALFTARSAPAHERVILTLRKWGVGLDHCVFLGGQDKGAFLKAFQADIFFDDKPENIKSANENLTTGGHVPHPQEI